MSKIMFPNRLFKTRIPDFVDNKDKVKGEGEHPFYAHEKDK